MVSQAAEVLEYINTSQPLKKILISAFLRKKNGIFEQHDFLLDANVARAPQ